MVVLAHAGTRATANDLWARLERKFSLTRRSFEHGYGRQKIVGLYRFIDWVMLLPEELEIEYDRRVDEYQEEHKMEYLSSMERRAMERGRQGVSWKGCRKAAAGHATGYAARRA